MPPVTELRSPPDSRMTGADSPVIADSSTLAIPSTTSPSPGMISPASTTTRSPTSRSVSPGTAPRVPSACASRRAVVSVLAARRVAACALPAPLGHGLGEVGEDDGEPQPDHDRPGERLGSAMASDGREHRADLDDEHDGVATIRAGRACARRPGREAEHHRRVEQARRDALGGGVGVPRSVPRRVRMSGECVGVITGLPRADRVRARGRR